MRRAYHQAQMHHTLRQSLLVTKPIICQPIIYIDTFLEVLMCGHDFAYKFYVLELGSGAGLKNRRFIPTIAIE